MNVFSDLGKLNRLFPRREKWKFGLLLVLMWIAAALEAIGVGAVPIFVAFVMDPSSLTEHDLIARWLPELPAESGLSLILSASALLFGFILLKNVYLAGYFYVQSRIVSMQRAQLAHRMFRAYQDAPYDWLLQRRTSELQRNIVEDTTRIFNGIVLPYLDLFLALALSLAIIAAMTLATPGATLISVAIVGAGMFIILRLMRKKLQQSGRTVRLEYEQSLKAIQQGIGALVDARIARREATLAKVHREIVTRLSKAHTMAFTTTRATPAAIETLAILGLLAVLLIILGTGETMASALPALSVIGVALLRLKQVAARAAQAVHLIHQFGGCLPDLLRDLGELDALNKARQKRITGQPLIRAFECLELKGVGYTYPGAEKSSLEQVSLKLRAGESIAFIGTTGCGKSTLANLVLGLLEPAAGSVKVNGFDIREDPDGWRACLGYVSQSLFLIDDTIRANIAFGIPSDEVCDRRMAHALRSAVLTDFVDSLPAGLDTVVGERGVRLSGGQRQRLGIARALYMEPQVLIMDEATSALDHRTEREVLRAIRNLEPKPTTITIAHRATTVEGCDHVYLLSSGRIESVVPGPSHRSGDNRILRTLVS